MDSNTEAIIIAVLVALLVLTFAYLTYLVLIIRRNRKSDGEEPSVLEINNLDSQGDGYNKQEAIEAAEIIQSPLDNGIKQKEEVLENPQEVKPNLSSLTDGSVASARSHPSSSNSNEPSEGSNSNGNSNTVPSRSEDQSSSSLNSIIEKRPPQCPYKGKLQCTCQQTRKSADSQRLLHNPHYTSVASKNQASMVSGGRYSTSGIERLQSGEQSSEKVQRWISNTSPKQSRRNRNPLRYQDGNDEDDDDTPILTQMTALGKEVISPVSSPRSRTRPSSPLSPVHRASSSSIIYPNAGWSDFYGWSSTPNLHSFPSSPTRASTSRFQSQQIRSQTPPRSASSTLSSSKKSSSKQPQNAEADYYQQRIT